MIADQEFLQKFIDAIAEEEPIRGSRNYEEKKDFLSGFFKDHGREIHEFSRQTRPRSRGPTVSFSPESGRVIIVTDESPYDAFKEVCLGAVIIACGDDGIDEYGKDFSEENSIPKLFKKYPEIQGWHAKILAAFLG